MNQHPEQMARDRIDAALEAVGWVVQDRKWVNLAAGRGVVSGVAVKEYQTDIGPADYVLFVDRLPVGVIEAKREEEGLHLTEVEEQSRGYASAKLQYLDNTALPFVYESTGAKIWFTDYRDPKPRARELFAFHRPESLGR